MNNDNALYVLWRRESFFHLFECILPVPSEAEIFMLKMSFMEHHWEKPTSASNVKRCVYSQHVGHGLIFSKERLLPETVKAFRNVMGHLFKDVKYSKQRFLWERSMPECVKECWNLKNGKFADFFIPRKNTVLSDISVAFYLGIDEETYLDFGTLIPELKQLSPDTERIHIKPGDILVVSGNQVHRGTEFTGCSGVMIPPGLKKPININLKSNICLSFLFDPYDFHSNSNSQRCYREHTEPTGISHPHYANSDIFKNVY